jgi:hypothetical protein
MFASIKFVHLNAPKTCNKNAQIKPQEKITIPHDLTRFWTKESWLWAKFRPLFDKVLELVSLDFWYCATERCYVDECHFNNNKPTFSDVGFYKLAKRKKI